MELILTLCALSGAHHAPCRVHETIPIYELAGPTSVTCEAFAEHVIVPSWKVEHAKRWRVKSWRCQPAGGRE